MPDDTPPRELPPALQPIDLADLAGVEPRALILDPARVAADLAAAGRALAYARAGGQGTYDAIGFRAFAAAPRRGPAPLQTSAWTALQRELAGRLKAAALVDEILNQQPKLRHRPLALPQDVEDFRYTIDRDLIHMHCSRTDAAGRQVAERWTFSLTDLPEPLLADAQDRDEGQIAAQQLLVNLEGTHWLPFTVLLAEGRFRRLQEIRTQLRRHALPGAFYCFLSHRWLTPRHPDPDARQAQLAAWQLVAYLAEAVRVAHQRGLQQPRRFSPSLGVAVGPRGADLAEALIVNVLRPALDEEELAQAAAEVLPLESVLEDYGVSGAGRDAGLAELNGLLAGRPVLRKLTEHVYLWYDYSCLPQPPRDGDDVPLFVQGLKELSAAQIIGRTAIMLDDADDYLSRAWCTLEALTADTFGGATDLLVGSARPTAAQGEVEHYFETLLRDRPHVVWRAVLDTEVFRVQSQAECMRRLGLDVTDPNDLPFIYDRLRSLSAPAKIHIDDSEIVTGVLPLPASADRAIAVRARGSGRAVAPDAGPATRATLDWRAALSLATAWGEADSAATTPPFCSLPAATGATTCHVAVIGACEGEAIVLANWVRGHRAELESLFSVSVTGISWLATDIAPVGHIAVGALEALPVVAGAWVVVAPWARLRHCKTTGFLLETLKWAGVSYATLAIDQPRDNVEIPQEARLPEGIEITEFIVGIDLAENPPKKHGGGLFQWQVQEGLL